jgi:hypothetical protein
LLYFVQFTLRFRFYDMRLPWQKVVPVSLCVFVRRFRWLIFRTGSLSSFLYCRLYAADAIEEFPPNSYIDVRVRWCHLDCVNSNRQWSTLSRHLAAYLQVVGMKRHKIVFVVNMGGSNKVVLFYQVFLVRGIIFFVILLITVKRFSTILVALYAF